MGNVGAEIITNVTVPDSLFNYGKGYLNLKMMLVHVGLYITLGTVGEQGDHI